MSTSNVAALVKQAVDIVDVISQVVPLRRTGSRHVGLCPFHQEKTASFHVDGQNQFFHCFGCGTGGDVLTFVMKFQNLTFGDAVKFLADRYNIALPQDDQAAEAPREERNRLYKVLEVASDFFYSQLHHTQTGREAREYLRKRALPEPTIQAQRLGYAPNLWDGMLRRLRDAGIEPELGEKAGLLVKSPQNRYYDRFRHRLIFPIADDHGRVVAFGGRSLDGSEPKYLNSPETPVYSKGRMLYQLARAREACKQFRQVVLVEGYMDLLAFHAREFYRVVATLGTALTAHQIRLIARMADEVVLLYDADAAGQKAMFRALPLLLQEQLGATCLQLPEGMDPDDFLRERGLQAFELMMQNRQDLGLYAIHKAIDSWDGTTGGKSRVLTELEPIFHAVRQPVLKSEYLRAVADRLSVPEAAVDKQLYGASRSSGKAPVHIKPSNIPAFSEAQSPESTLVRIMVKYPSLIEVVKSSGALVHFQEPAIKMLAEALVHVGVGEGGSFDHAAVYELLPNSEVRTLFTRIAMEPDPYGDLEAARLHMRDRLRLLGERDARRRPKDLRAALRQAELQGDKELVQELLEQIQNLYSSRKKPKGPPGNV